MARRPGKQIAEATAEPPTKGAEAAEKIVKDNAKALTVSGNASRAAVQELTRVYQELATKNAKNLTGAMQALAAVKSPAEFIELQQRLIKEGVEAAVTDSRHIAQLTTAVFTAAFEPVKKRLEKTAQT
jgi:phasin family protein